MEENVAILLTILCMARMYPDEAFDRDWRQKTENADPALSMTNAEEVGKDSDSYLRLIGQTTRTLQPCELERIEALVKENSHSHCHVPAPDGREHAGVSWWYWPICQRRVLPLWWITLCTIRGFYKSLDNLLPKGSRPQLPRRT